MISLVTVIGHGVNLLPHFIEHYEKYVDEINIVVYKTPTTFGLETEIEDIIHGLKNVKIVKIITHRAFDWEKVTQLYNEVKLMHPRDWWVVADIDEFHLYPHNDLRDMVKQCNAHGWDIVRGGFLDRMGEYGDFPEIIPYKDIFTQFPQAGFFRYPMSKACPNKICVMKGYVELTPGQHYAKIDGHTTWRWQGWNHPLIAPIEEYSVQVHHFKWDSTSLIRLQQVASENKPYSFSDEYKTMLKAIEDNNRRITIQRAEYMFQTCFVRDFNTYKMWNKLINKIASI